MDNINKCINELLKCKYDDLSIISKNDQIEIIKSTYFKVTLKLRNPKINENYFDISIYMGLLGYLFNKNFNIKVAELKTDLEKIILENGFKYSYLSL